MIVYLDTSALVPLLVEEPTSPACRRLWAVADAVSTVRVSYAEAAAALASARRQDRIDRRIHASALRQLSDLWRQLAVQDVDQELVEHAAALADRHGLRGYDAIHAAAARAQKEPLLVAAAGDRALLDAWRDMGLATFDTHGT